jgi:hypothetical protein
VGEALLLVVGVSDGDSVGVSVGVGGVGVGVGDGFTYVETVITTVVPCGCVVNADGLCSRTVPLVAFVLLSWTVSTLNPAPSSLLRASSSVSPTTLGTFFGPAE